MDDFAVSIKSVEDCHNDDPIQNEEVDQVTAPTPLKPGQLGASGIPSGRRSTITKSFRGNGQGGFDEAGDPDKGMEGITILASSRPSNMASLISQALGDEPDDLKHFLCIPLTNNVKALFVMMVMFAAISLGQYFAAIAANSQALKADVSLNRVIKVVSSADFRYGGCVCPFVPSSDVS
ncbi:MAG: hypothetical protein ACI8RD_005987 [Bacillariaceae sp.]|jgi:hypothetical protein